MDAATGGAVAAEAPCGPLADRARAHFARWWPVLS
jgi:hypothetical protein